LSQPDIARVVETARRAAAAANHAFVGTEHLLTAALLDSRGPAARSLKVAGVSLDGLETELLGGLPTAEAGTGPPPLSRFAERAVADAEKSGDLLLVLLKAPRGRVASVLAKRGIKLAELRKALEPAPEPETPRPARRLPPHLESKRKPAAPTGPFPWMLLLLLAVPASVLLSWQHAAPLLVFGMACLGVVPLAGLMGQATEQLAERSGPTVGGLLNATFGNAAELIIAIVALRAGLVELVKASITGSILGNLLLILGLSLFAGGLRSPILKFNRTSAGMSAAMLALAVAGLVFPTLFHTVHPGTTSARLPLSELQLSEAVAVILAVTYGCSLLFTLRTHKTLFGVDAAATPEGPAWGMGKSLAVLAFATGGVVVESELLVHSIEGATRGLGLSETFLGLVIVPLVGNAAEHATAVTAARRGKTELSLQIALGSSTQVALLIAPLLVLAGVLLGQPLSLVFTPLEVLALAVSTIVVAIITLDGESHWFEGVQLLALYAMVGAASYFL